MEKSYGSTECSKEEKHDERLLDKSVSSKARWGRTARVRNAAADSDACLGSDRKRMEWAAFDPIQLAELLRIDVVPSQDVLEARTVTAGSKFRIEYNPNRGVNRARYSIAHEIAHTLFPDCAEAIRHRKPYHGSEGDNWQLEMLCNIGAAEILMPVGSGLECPIYSDDFSKLLDLRQQYKVSTEALLPSVITQKRP